MENPNFQYNNYEQPKDFPPPYPGLERPAQDPYTSQPGNYGMSSNTGYSNAPPVGFENQQPGNVYVVPPQPVILLRSFGSSPMNMRCPHCQYEIVTKTTPVNGSFTWFLAFGMCIFGLWCGCCCAPFCIDGCRDMEHYCSNCKALLGTYRRM